MVFLSYNLAIHKLNTMIFYFIHLIISSKLVEFKIYPPTTKLVLDPLWRSP